MQPARLLLRFGDAAFRNGGKGRATAAQGMPFTARVNIFGQLRMQEECRECVTFCVCDIARAEYPMPMRSKNARQPICLFGSLILDNAEHAIAVEKI